MVPGSQGVGLQGLTGSMGSPTGSQLPGGQGVGLQGPRGSGGRPTGSLGITGWAKRAQKGSRGRQRCPRGTRETSGDGKRKGS